MIYNKTIVVTMALTLSFCGGKFAKAAVGDSDLLLSGGNECPAAKDVKNALVDKVKNSKTESFASGFTGTYELNTLIQDPKKLGVEKPQKIGGNICKYYLLNGSTTDGAAKVQLEGNECPAAKDVKNALADKVKNSKAGSFTSGFKGTYELNTLIQDPKKLGVEKPQKIGGNICKYYLLNGSTTDGAAKVQLGN